MSAATVFGPGYPDQACDLVVTSVVEEYLRRDPEARLNIRACGGKGVLFLAGEVASTADFDVSSRVKQTLAGCGVSGVIEPFIAFEAMLPSWAQGPMSREPVAVQGYATDETAELLPKSVVLARTLAKTLEEKRAQDQDWFWLGADYEVTVVPSASSPVLVLIRAEHLDSHSLDEVRRQIQRICEPVAPGANWRINPAGEETRAGLTHRIGSSGRINLDSYIRTPLTISPVGLHTKHPRVAGAQACRVVAERLVRAGLGRSVAVRATWLPFETQASYARAWNERNEDLSHELQTEELDLKHTFV